jgi:hypothetical protein
MQKLINVLALASFGINVALVGAGYYVYSQREKIIQSATDKAAELAEKKLKDVVTKAATEGAVNAVKPMLNGMVKNALPKLPTKQVPVMKNVMSGPAINF